MRDEGRLGEVGALLVAGNDEEARRLLATLELMALSVDQLQVARELCLEALHPQGAERVEEELARRGVAIGPGEVPATEPTAASDEDVDPDEDGALFARTELATPVLPAKFLEWFGGRRDLYAQQWFDERRRRSGYRPVRAPLTEAVARGHLEGRITLGQYLLDAEGACHFGVIDLDLGANALSELKATLGEEVGGAEHPRLRAYARALVDAGHSLGLPLIPEDSGSRGLHLWLFLRPRRSARAARMLLSQVLIRTGHQPPEVTVEIFPKQVTPGPRGLSSLVKLPLGVHQVTMRRCWLLDEQLEPIRDPEAALASVRAPDNAAVDAVLGGRLAALPAPTSARGEDLPEKPEEPKAHTVAALLRSIEVGPNEREVTERMLERCTVLRALSDKAYRERRLSPAEIRAVIYTLGLVSRDPRTARGILVAAGAPTKDLERATKGLPSPAGCKKLRTLVPTAAQCGDCPSETGLTYSSPVLHALGGAGARHSPARVAAPWVLAGEPVVEDPLTRVGEALQRIEDRLSRLAESGKEQEGTDGSGVPDL